MVPSGELYLSSLLWACRLLSKDARHVAFKEIETTLLVHPSKVKNAPGPEAQLSMQCRILPVGY